MTLPTDYIFPEPTNETFLSPLEAKSYLRQLTRSLTDMYQDIVDNVNGYMEYYTPKVTGVSTYTVQQGYYRRSGIITQYWFDVVWTASTAAGDVTIELPYEVADNTAEPWVGVVESTSSSNTFTGYLTLNADPGTYNCYIRDNVSGSASTNLALANAGGFRGFIEYVGKDLESS